MSTILIVFIMFFCYESHTLNVVHLSHPLSSSSDKQHIIFSHQYSSTSHHHLFDFFISAWQSSHRHFISLHIAHCFIYPFLRYFKILLIKFISNKIPISINTRNSCTTTTHTVVQHCFAFIGVCFD